MSTTGQLKHVIIKKSPNSVLKTLAAGNELVKNQYQLLSNLATFFLPVGEWWIYTQINTYLNIIQLFEKKTQREVVGVLAHQIKLEE